MTAKLNPDEMKAYLADLSSQAEFLHGAGKINDGLMAVVKDAIAVLDPGYVFEGTADEIDKTRGAAGLILAYIKTTYERELMRSDRP